MLRVACDPDPDARPWIEEPHRRERVYMYVHLVDGGTDVVFRCPACGAEVNAWEAEQVIPLPYAAADNLALRMADVAALLVVRSASGELSIEYPRDNGSVPRLVVV